VDKANALPTVPQENKSRRSGHMMCYQNRPTLISYRQEQAIPKIRDGILDASTMGSR